ncbi:MAG TPA: DUF3500 domain-containing protein [Gemmataceae bacterium]|jgi:hypothetical protein|nr:DUF3500 domain-containing protein [Gemmataceae bacterium]
MKSARILLAPAAFGLLVGVATIAQVNSPAGVRMTEAAGKFLDGLTAEQKEKAAFAFDSPERLRWNFVPLQDNQRRPTRKGLRFEEMTAPQREAALALLRAGTSDRGYQQATTIMSLESILHDLEKGGRTVRDPWWYFVTVFGTPAKSGKWGWRIEGHHLSLNYVVEDGKVAAATPAFFGANPAAVRDGPRKGLRAIPEVDDLARELFLSLDDSQRQLAQQPAEMLPRKMFPEVDANTATKVGEPQGVPAAKMTEPQKTTLDKLIHAYIERLPGDVAQSELGRMRDAGIDKVHFAFAGGTETGQPHTYRLHGPTFVAEFLNVQEDSAKNPANHIHSAWRHLPKDFGL